MSDKSLMEQFPDLIYAKKAQGWLNYVENKKVDLWVQLNDRNILDIKLKPLLTRGGLGKTHGGFVIWLNDLYGIEENVKNLGHEIGHTFHCIVRNSSVFSLAKDNISDELFFTIERFCDAFSKKWICVNGEETIKEFFKKKERINML